jgi:hypothetical protein
MSLFGEIKQFVGKFVKNPIKTGVVTYLVWKILKSNSESIQLEGIQIVKQAKGKELIKDLDTDMYAVVRGNDVNFHKSINDAQKDFNENMTRKERLNVLLEGI